MHYDLLNYNSLQNAPFVRSLKVSHKRLINKTTKRDHVWDTLKKDPVIWKSGFVKRPFYVDKSYLKYGKDSKNNNKIFGRPDFTIVNYRIMIFCDGEFFQDKDWYIRKE